MKVTLYSLVGLLAMAMALFAEVEARPNVDTTTGFGIAWATNNAWAPKLANNPHTSVYHHWQDGHIPALSRNGIKFVPMLWGPRYMSKWYRLKGLFPKYRYTHALFANEPDVSSQANMSPGQAAALFVKEMVPLRNKFGTKLSSPNICYNIDWLKSFTKILKNRGQHYDFVAAHYYGPVNDFGRFTKFIRNLHAAFPGKNIWITEYGLTQSSGPSAQSAKNFMVRASEYMAGTGYIKAMFPFGVFAINSPPDSFGAAQNAVFTSNGNLRSIGQYYAYASPHARRSLDESETPRDIRRRHHAMMLRLREHDAEADKDDPDTSVANPTDCDEANERDNCKFLKAIADDHDVDALDEDAALTPEELKELQVFDHELARRDVVDDEDLDPDFLASLEEEDVVQQP